MAEVAAVVLAAGAGTRFAGPTHKLRATLDGQRLVDRAVRAAVDAAIGPVLVVTGADALDDLDAEATRVPNPAWREGLATSLRVGIGAAREAGRDVVVVGLADQPGVTPEAWRAVAAASATPVAVATYAGARGHPVRLAAPVWDALPTGGDRGARDLVRSRPDLVTEVPCPGSPADVDTLDDLARWG